MSPTLAFLALLIEAHARLSGLAGSFNRASSDLDRAPDRGSGPQAQPRTGCARARRRAAGAIALVALIAVAGVVGFALQHNLPRLPFGLLVLAVLASTLLAQRSLHAHVAQVAFALEQRRARGRASSCSTDRRARSRRARRGRRGARGDREPGRELLRRGGRAGLLDGGRRPAGCRGLQGHQHRRQHDRTSHTASRRFRLCGRPARRSRQSAGLASLGSS